MTVVEEAPARIKEELVYGLNDRPPFSEGLFVAIQHTFAIFVPIAVILAILGLFPIIGGFLQKTPAPVLGGATILMFGSVAVAGFNILRTVEMDSRASVITAVSLSAALGVTFVPEFVAQLPPLLTQVFSSGISTGAIFALILNIILPGRSSVPDLAAEVAELAKEELI